MQIKDKSVQEEILQKSIQEMEQNSAKIDNEIKTMTMSKYSKKPRKELERMALERFNNYKRSLGDY